MTPPSSGLSAEAFIRNCFPQLAPGSMTEIFGGWDSRVFEIDGWIVRLPRRPEVTKWVRAEIRLLAELADHLTASVPRFDLVCDTGTRLALGHRKIPGAALAPTDLEPAGAALLAASVGRFLGELHAFPADRAASLLGAERSAAGAQLRHDVFVEDARVRVLPLFGRAERSIVEGFLDGWHDPEMLHLEPVLTHSDLGPEHLLCESQTLSGVIDWSDAQVGDPAIDFAWLLHGTPMDFRSRVLEAYPGNVDGIERRSLFWHRLGPFHEVIHGLDRGDDRFVTSGLEGITARLLHRS
ncbi:MAG TPA: phosphotransferase [Actinomycetota bacterium]|nr:phosphotransferase [Actinomycetota bacterium]